MKRTPLFEEHKRLGGRLVDFGGWALPVQYSGVMDEHLACRSAAGIFDVSHMGEVFVEGEAAAEFLDYLVTNAPSKTAVGQAQYTAMCREDGGIIDDLVIYRRTHDRFLLVVNASNTDKDFDHIRDVASKFRVRVSNESPRFGQIALQGPLAEKILQTITQTPLSAIKTYWFSEGTVLGNIPAILARTGYTGEDGFEIYLPAESTSTVWRALLDAGSPLGLKPCGLGARDTLRLEMKYALYGNELTEQTHPLEAGLGWVVKLDKPDFLGKSALLRFKASGLSRKLVGLRLTERGIARHGYSVYSSEKLIGEVTSGTQSPSLKSSIAIAYVATPFSAEGTRLLIDIRGQKIPAEVIATPFYKKKV